MSDDPSRFVEVNGEFIKRLDTHMVLEDERVEQTEKREKEREGWHVGKEIPLAVIAALIAQTIGVVWLSAATVTKVDLIKESMVIEKAAQAADQKRQDDDSRRSEDRIIVRLDKFDAKLDRLIEKK